MNLELVQAYLQHKESSIQQRARKILNPLESQQLCLDTPDGDAKMINRVEDAIRGALYNAELNEEIIAIQAEHGFTSLAALSCLVSLGELSEKVVTVTKETLLALQRSELFWLMEDLQFKSLLEFMICVAWETRQKSFAGDHIAPEQEEIRQLFAVSAAVLINRLKELMKPDEVSETKRQPIRYKLARHRVFALVFSLFAKTKKQKKALDYFIYRDLLHADSSLQNILEERRKKKDD